MTDFTPRPTIYKGITMRSRLEARFATWLDSWKAEWTYEPAAFASPRGQYLPDFRLDAFPCCWLASPVTVYVEVKYKGWPRWADDENALDKHDALMLGFEAIWSNEPEAVCVLAQPEAVSLILPDVGGMGGITWPVLAHWTTTPDKKLAIAQGVSDPWPDGYWKPK